MQSKNRRRHLFGKKMCEILKLYLLFLCIISFIIIILIGVFSISFLSGGQAFSLHQDLNKQNIYLLNLIFRWKCTNDKVDNKVTWFINAGEANKQNNVKLGKGLKSAVFWGGSVWEKCRKDPKTELINNTQKQLFLVS